MPLSTPKSSQINHNKQWHDICSGHKLGKRLTGILNSPMLQQPPIKTVLQECHSFDFTLQLYENSIYSKLCQNIAFSDTMEIEKKNS